MSERLAEIERRMKVCLSEIEGLRAQRLALHNVSFPDIKDKDERSYTSPDEWDRFAKITLFEGRIKALEGEYAALKVQKVAAELEGYIDREIERARQETSLPHQRTIGHCANDEVTERLDEAAQDARRELREIRLRYMTVPERAEHEMRQRDRQRRREQEQEYGHER